MGDGLEVHTSRTPPIDWDRWLLDAPGRPGFAQTTVWATMASAARQSPVWFIEVARDERRVGSALLTLDAGVGPFRRMPGVPGTLLCLDGPSAPTGDPDVLHAILEAIDAVRHETGRPALILQPPLRAPFAPELEQALDTPWSVVVRATAIVNLNGSPEDLWKGMAKPVRRNIRRCEEANVLVREIGDEQDYRTAFLEAFNRRVGAPRQWRRVQNEAMWTVGAGRTHRFFLAEHEGTVLAALGTQRWNGTVTEIASARTPEGQASGLPVQDLLHWKILEAHQHSGDREFDLAGFNPAGTDPKEQGIRQFKTKWGGEIVATSRWERPPEAPMAIAVRRLRRATS